MPGENARRRHRDRNRNNKDASSHGGQGGNNKRHCGRHGRHGGNHGRPDGDNGRHGGRNDRQVFYNGQERVDQANNAGARASPGYQGGPRYLWAMEPATNKLRSVPYYEHMGYHNYSVRTGLPLKNNNGNIQLTWPEFMAEVRRGNGPHNNEGNYEIITEKQRNNSYGNPCNRLNHQSNYNLFEDDYDRVPRSNGDFVIYPYSNDHVLEMNANVRGPRTPPLQSYDQALNHHYEAAGIMGHQYGRQLQARHGGTDPQQQDEARNQHGRSKTGPSQKKRMRFRRRAQEQEAMPTWNGQPKSPSNVSFGNEPSCWGHWEPTLVEERNRQPTSDVNDWSKELRESLHKFPDCSDHRSARFGQFGLFRQEESPGMEEKQESTSNESSSESDNTAKLYEIDKELADLKSLVKSFMDITFVRNIMKTYSEENFEALHALVQE